MKAIEILSDGTISERNATRKDISAEFHLHARDLRPIFSVKQLSTISPRGEAIILNLGDLKIVVGATRAFVFNAQNPEIKNEFLPEIIAKRKAEPSTPLEIVFLETALAFSLKKLHEKFSENEKRVRKIFAKLKNSISDEYFEALLNLKKHLSKLERTIKELEEATEEILKDDDDLAKMCLSGASNAPEIENVLEHAWEQFEDLSHRIAELNENIDDTQEIITLKMANRRNVIIKFDLVVTFVTAILSGLAVIAGVFGMNLKSGLEESEIAFWAVTFAVFAGFFLSFLAASWYFRRKKIW